MSLMTTIFLLQGTKAWVCQCRMLFEGKVHHSGDQGKINACLHIGLLYNCPVKIANHHQLSTELPVDN